MKLEDLSLIVAGDNISIENIEGKVVFSSLSESYSTLFPKTDWIGKEYQGIMIQQSNGALIFHDEEYLVDYCEHVHLIE